VDNGKDPSEARFGVAVSEWMRALRTLQKDAAFARSLEQNDLLRSIATRRLNDVEATAVDAPDLDDLAQVATTHGEVLWMLAARHACDALAARMASQALDSPATLTALMVEASDILSDARPMADQLAVWEHHEEVGPTYLRFAAAVAELEAEMARYSAIAQALYVGLEESLQPRSRRPLADWDRVLEALRGRVEAWDDPVAVVSQARELVEGLITRYVGVAEREDVRETAKTYDRLLLTARAHGLTSGNEALSKEAEKSHRSTHEVLNRLLPMTPEEEARAGFPGCDTPVQEPTGWLTPSRARAMAMIGLMVLVAVGAGGYAAFLRPSMNYTSLTSEQVRAIWPELTGGYVVDREEGQLFVGYLVRQDQQAPTSLVANMSERILDELGPLGVTEVLILDRNAVPIGLMQGQ